MELQSQVDTLKRRGLGLAAISYDSPENLADFSARRGITFPLLSDPGSNTIRRYDLLNREVAEGTREYGIPYPGTFVLNERGIVTARFFEEYYRERNSVSSILVRLGGAQGLEATRASTAHLTLTASASDSTAAPGTRLSLVLDITPKPKMHVYAPGATDYLPIALKLDPQPGVLLRAPQYPKSEILFFKPLNERVPVYAKPFRIVQDVTLDVTPQGQALFKPMKTLTITGKVAYQACDDQICFLPASVPVSWTFTLRPLDFERPKKP